MNLFRKIKYAIRRTWLLLNPKKWPAYVHDNIVGYLILRKFNYLENKNTHYIQTSFIVSESYQIEMDYFVDGSNYIYRGVIMEGIPEERMRDAMVMSSHLNNRLRGCNIYVNPEHHIIFVILKVDLPFCIMYPGTMYDLLSTHYEDCLLSLQAYDRLYNSADDPIFIIAEVIERMKKDISNQENNQA
jgi:hypothetical protein